MDEEEQSFLQHVTSHLPADCSVEQRDAYVQHVLARWRLNREHSQQEKLLTDKYLATIREHFRPQAPELYDFQQWPIDENLVKMVKNNALDPDVIQQVRLGYFVSIDRSQQKRLVCRFEQRAFTHFRFFPFPSARN